MSRQVHLGDHGNVSFRGIGHHFLQFFFGVIPPVADPIVLSRVTTYHSGIAVCSNFGELWIRVYLDPPSLVVRSMPMKAVQVMQSE